MENYSQLPPEGGQDNQSQINFTNQSPQSLRNQNFEYQQAVQENVQSSSSESQHPAMHFFLYLVSFLSLCFLSTGTGSVLFQLINKNFSDLESFDYFSYFSQYAIKYGISTLIIATPIYFSIMYLIGVYIFEGKIKEDSRVRKWLTYIVLFIASSTIIGDLISLVFNLLGGEIIARFMLKVLVVILIAGVIFSYYLIDMRRKNMTGQKFMINKIFAGISLFVIIISTVLGFTIIDSPFASRDKKIDQQVVSDLRMVEEQIENYYRKNSKLPASLDELKNNDTYYSGSKLNKSIVYQKSGTTNYKLCAEFKRASSEYRKGQSMGYYSDFEDNYWEFKKGKYCFDKNVNEITPSYKSAPVTMNSFDPTEAQRKARIAQVKSTLSSVVPMGIICQDDSKEIISGKGGEVFCLSEENYRWPSISLCGPNPEDTRWIVQKGNSKEWTFTVSCKNFNNCDGPGNALCNEEGCKFGGSCQ